MTAELIKFAALHDLIANVVEFPRDLVARETSKSINLVTSQDDDQGRLIGKKGANITSIQILAAWLGYTRLTLAGDFDPRAAGKGFLPTIPADPMPQGKEIEALFEQLVCNLFQAAGSACTAEARAESHNSELFLSIVPDPKAPKQPDAITVAALSKVLRAISIRYEHREFFFSCE